MTSQTPAITIPSPRRGPGRRLVLGLAAVAFAVAVVAAIGVWQVRARSTASTAQHEAAAPVSAAVTRPAPTSAVRADAVVYLVASPEQAVVVQAGIAAGYMSAEGQWISTPQATVLVAGTPEEAARAAEMLGADQHIRLTSGRPDRRVVDLRP